jgi:hypothetical protein
MNYALKSNYPFYTEQYDPRADLSNLLRNSIGESGIPASDGATFTVGDPIDGTAEEAAKAKNNEMRTGVSQGRKYPLGADRPGFINPSPEPLRVSMEKQIQLEKEIRLLVNLNVSSLTSDKNDSITENDLGSLEAGLSYIGLELEYGERLIAKSWAEYEENNDEITINYPKKYSIRPDEDRRNEAKELIDMRPSIPSLKFQKESTKEIVNLLVGSKVTEEELKEIYGEIDKAKVINTDHETVRNDHEAGLVSTKTASLILNYPEGEVEQAKKDHADRLKRIAISQSVGGGMAKAGARGVDDLDDEPAKTAKDEKTLSQEATLNEDPKKAVRGKDNA